jgi:hypothetical protein
MVRSVRVVRAAIAQVGLGGGWHWSRGPLLRVRAAAGVAPGMDITAARRVAGMHGIIGIVGASAGSAGVQKLKAWAGVIWPLSKRSAPAWLAFLGGAYGHQTGLH